MPEMNVGADSQSGSRCETNIPADACASDLDHYLSIFECFSICNFVLGRKSVGNPELMFRIRVYANVWLGNGDRGRHDGDRVKLEVYKSTLLTIYLRSCFEYHMVGLDYPAGYFPVMTLQRDIRSSHDGGVDLQIISRVALCSKVHISLLVKCAAFSGIEY